MILYGAPVREEIKKKLIKRVKRLRKKPCLAIIQVGDKEDSNIYIRKKEEFGKDIGAEVVVRKFKLDTNTRIKANDTNGKKVIEEIEKLNRDKKVNGIIVQLPLPVGLNTKKIIQAIDADKDADGLREIKEKRENGVLITPATAKAVMALLDFYKIKMRDKKVAVIGQSILAGKPISDEFEKRGAKVFRCDTKTQNIPAIAKKCDILISAVGKAGLVTKKFVNKKQAVIDVGINRTPPPGPLPKGEGVSDSLPLGGRAGDGVSKLVGDAKFEEIEPIVRAITPVPGGVGPLTVACLFENLLDLCK